MNTVALATLRAQISAARNHERTFVVGILNVTPDSFSDGGRYFEVARAVIGAEQMLADGADLLDIGGESTRPATFGDHSPLKTEEEKRRVLPVIAALREAFPSVPLSIDTYKAEVAELAIQTGAVMVNDISALRADAGMAGVVAGYGVPVCLMHLLGLPRAIPAEPVYEDVVSEVCDHLRERTEFAKSVGIALEDILIDPGIGFGKNLDQNLELLNRQEELLTLGYPVMIGTSRKSTIGKVLGGLPPEDRLEGTAATVAIAVAKGATFVRAHDVKPMARVARMSDAIVRRSRL